MICAYIDQYRHQFGVEPICRVLTEHDIQIAPSSYYAHRRQPVTDALRAEAVLVELVGNREVVTGPLHGHGRRAATRRWTRALGLPVLIGVALALQSVHAGKSVVPVGV